MTKSRRSDRDAAGDLDPNAPDPRLDFALRVQLEEYKEMTSDIRARISLQQRNFNVYVVLFTAATGYLVNYWNRHDLQVGSQALVHSEIVVVAVLVPLIASMFIWRHNDHDANIIDKALYIDQELRPRLSSTTGDPRVLSWERFLRAQRLRRPIAVGLLVVVGTEQIIMFATATGYLGVGWYLRLAGSTYAGEARGLFDVMLYVGTATLCGSAISALHSGLRYGYIGSHNGKLIAPAKRGDR